MNFLTIFTLIATLAKPVVLTIQAIHGEAVAGASKSDMAKTALAGALGTAGLLLPVQDDALATQLAQLTSAAIDAAVAAAKAKGEYQAATATSLHLPAPTTKTT